MVVGLLASATRGHAQATLVWTNGSDNWNSTTAWQTNLFTAYTNEVVGIVTNQVTNSLCVADLPPNSIVVTNCVGGTGGFPGIGDQARFTNNTSYTVTLNANTDVGLLTVSNTAGTVTIDAGANTLAVTNRFRVGDGGATSTVVWAGGTLSAPGQPPGNVVATLQIGTAGTNTVGTLIVTNGTIVGGGSINLGTTAPGQIGRLVISGPSSLFTNVIGQVPNLTHQLRLRTAGSQLVITNGGKFFWRGGEVRAASNTLIHVSGPGGLLYSTNVPGVSTHFSVGHNDGTGPGSLMIVSNGATIVSDGTFTVGRGGGSAGQFSAFNTAIVVRAGSLIVPGPANRVIVGTGSIGGSTSNNLTVYDGGYFESGGPNVTIGNSAGLVGNSFNMGGVGAVSTGLAVLVNNNSTAVGSRFVVSNAVFTCTRVAFSGASGNSVTVLSNGTLNVTGPIVGTTTNNLQISSANGGTITIDAGTINANAGGSNNITVVINGGDTSGGSRLNIINGGKLLSEVGTIGQNSGYNTGIVSGVGSVWSNWSTGVNITNGLSVGGSGSLSSGFNHLAVRDGARLYNNGTLNIGLTNTAPNNTVVFGGAGAASFIRNQGSLNIGGGGFAQDNTLLVTNATLDCDILNVGKSETVNNTLTFKGGTITVGLIRVRESNTFVFTAGTLSAGGMDTDSGANSSNVFVVGDGTSVAYYDMAPGGTGIHGFSNGGVVFTNNTFLRGSGTMTGTIKVLGTFVPGFSVGSIFTSNSLSFGSSAVLNYDLGTSSDSVTVNADLKLDGTLNIADAGGFTTGNYTLFTYLGALSTNSVIPTIGSNPNGSLTYTINTNTPGSVILQVTGGSDPYTTWASAYGLAGGNALGTADPDGDGVNNTNEFLTGFNPTNSAAFARITSIGSSGGGTNQVISYLGASGDSTYTGGPASRTNVLEFSPGTNIASVAGNYTNNFSSTGLTNILSGGTGLGSNVTQTISGAATNKPARYYRVRVLTP